MRFYLISDNIDTYTGMRLAGVDGVVVHTKEEVSGAIQAALSLEDVGIILITEKLAHLCPEQLDEIKLGRRTPLIVEMPDRHGTGRTPDSITRYVTEAIGIKI